MRLITQASTQSSTQREILAQTRPPLTVWSRAAHGVGLMPWARQHRSLSTAVLTNINAKLGGEHKVRNFYNNIFNPSDPRFATIDTHAVAAALLTPFGGSDRPVAMNFGKSGGSNETGVSGTYPIYLEAYKRAAEARGLLPREMQSITWEAIRGMFKDTFKTKDNQNAIKDIWDQVDRGALTRDEALKQVHDMAGGIDHPDWWGGHEQTTLVVA
jgi:hypothetical protein